MPIMPGNTLSARGILFVFLSDRCYLHAAGMIRRVARIPSCPRGQARAAGSIGANT